MQNRSLVASLVVLISVALMFSGVAPQAQAQQPNYVSASFATQTKESIQINVLVGQSRVINFDRAIGRFSVSNPEVAEAVLVAPDQVLVNGKAFGQVNFIAWAKEGSEFLVFDVFVRANLSLIDSQIRALFPKDDISLSQANGSVVLSGKVAEAKTAERVEAVVQAAGFKTVNMLQSPVKEQAQVQLQVRVAEVSRSRLRDVGTSFGYQGSPGAGGYLNSGQGPSALEFPKVTPGGSIAGPLVSSALNLLVMGGNSVAMLRALQNEGAIRSLAEPNIIAMDGQQASFLAGGEFPVPIVQSGGDRVQVTVVFKEYGVRLNFKPTIIDEDHIRLELEPEVSTIDFANGVKFDGFLIPALKTRRAKTGVELRDGQSFLLGGLLDNSELRSFSKTPLIGDIPVLGQMFRSKSFQKSETELMFIVTAQLVKPVNRDDLPQMRGIDGLKNGSPLGVEPKGEGINGEHGYSTGGGASQTSGGASQTGSGASQTIAPSSKSSSASESISGTAQVEKRETRAAKVPALPRERIRVSFAPEALAGGNETPVAQVRLSPTP